LYFFELRPEVIPFVADKGQFVTVRHGAPAFG
jgi:hypothetical protein